MSIEDDKKKLAEQLEQFGDRQRVFMVSAIQQMLQTFADGASQLARQYEHDAWAREWVDLVKRAVSDLQAAKSIVQIQPLAPHGEVPS